MSGFIAEDIIEQVRLATDIVATVDNYVKLKRRGVNFIGLCPFHDEKTPSFTVSQEKQIFHCFGCGQGGNVFRFLMEHERMTFPEAVRFLASRSNITIPESSDNRQDRDEVEALYYAHTLALELFQNNLKLPRYTNVYSDYLQKSRGLTPATIDRFMLGVAGTSFDDLIKLTKNKNISPAILAKAGLAVFSSKRNTHYDRFHHRLMIPIHNISDKVIAFGGRALKKDEPAKYINSPETPLYSKSATLYGLNLNREAIRKEKCAIIVEGYFDLISLAQVGIENVVASSGTAFTQQQGKLLARYANTAYLFFDADSAGIKAAIRSVDSLYNAGVEVKVISAPAGEDPDSLARQGAETLHNIIAKAERYLQFRFKSFDRVNTGLVERNELISELTQISARIGDESLKELFITEAAEVMQVDKGLFRGTKQPDTAPRRSNTPSRTEDDWGQRNQSTIEAEFVSLLLAHTHLIANAAEQIKPEALKSIKLQNLYKALLTATGTTSALDAASFIGSLTDDTLRKTATFLVTSSNRWSDESASMALEDFVLTLATKRARQSSIAELTARLKTAEDSGDKETAQAILREFEEARKR
ncbi:DNA primase [bacterium AH-315-J21]|nr:DNA primase [bacterium AH-315-J21]